MFTLKKEHKVTPEDLQIEHKRRRRTRVDSSGEQVHKQIKNKKWYESACLQCIPTPPEICEKLLLAYVHAETIQPE